MSAFGHQLKLIKSLIQNSNLIFIRVVASLKRISQNHGLGFFVVLIFAILILPLLSLGRAKILNSANDNLIVDGQSFEYHQPINLFVSGLLATGGHNESDFNNTGKLAILENALRPLVFEFNSPKDLITYEVKENDSLIKIASSFNITTDTIIWANNLKNDRIKTGGKLIILPITGVAYKIKAGDTLESIAKKFKAEISAISEFNVLTANQLNEGEEIIIPDGILTNYAVALSNKKRSKVNKYYFSSLPSANDLQRPILTGRVSQGFHARNGIDIASSCGTPIFPSAPGLIGRAQGVGWNGGLGKNIVIYHNNGSQTVYAHLSKVNVRTGDYVPYNKIIGLVGTTGRSTGCHLHFETHGAKNPYLNYLN